MKFLLSGCKDKFALEQVYRRYLPKDVEVIDYFEPAPLGNGIAWRLIHRALGSGLNYHSNQNLLRLVRDHRPDVVWIFKGRSISRKTIRKIRQQGVLTVNYNADHPFQHYQRGSGNRRIAEAAMEYDLHLTYSHTILEELRRRGLNAERVAFGHEIDDEDYRPLVNVTERESIAFIGNPDPKRATVLKTLVEAGFPVVAYGVGWKQWLPDRPNLTVNGPVYGNAIREVMRSHRVQLNILRPHNIGSHNMRSIEIPAVGGMMLAEDSKEHRDFFSEQVSARFFDGFSDLLASARQLLSMSSESVQILRAQARKASLNNHYRCRVALAVDHIKTSLLRLNRRQASSNVVQRSFR